MAALSVYTVLIISFFSFWFICTIICQFRGKATDFIRGKLDLLNLIPLWTFFAPRPGKSDYHLLYRDKKSDESVTEWVELELSEGKSWLSFIWNPQKRDKKIIADVIQTLLITMNRYKEEKDRSYLMFTFPYILILHHISQQKSSITEPLYRQFVLAESPGYLEETEPGFILLSKFHQLNEF